jgi:hypothetical protein
MIVIKKKLRLIIFFLIFIIISPIVVLYAKGDIFTNGWNILETGGMYVTEAPVGSNIFLNSKSQTSTSFFSRDILIKNLRPGTYHVLVQKDGYNAWSNTLMVKNNLVVAADVFMLPTHVILEEIPKYISQSDGTATTTGAKIKNQDYVDILAVFSTSSPAVSKKIFSTSTIDFKDNLGTKISPIMDGKIGLWQDGSAIFAKWFGDDDQAPTYFCNGSDCSETITVYHSLAPIRKINFLPDYNSVVLVASGDEIFAIQIENNPDKVPQLIYKGTNPTFQMIGGDVYIKDNTYIAHVQL